MKEKLEKLAELIKHPEAEYSKQGRQLFVDLNLGHQATLDLLYVLAPELESHDFIWINEVNTYLSRFLTFWIMAELELGFDRLVGGPQVLRADTGQRHHRLPVRQAVGFVAREQPRHHVAVVVHGLVGEQVVLDHRVLRHAEGVEDQRAGEAGAVLQKSQVNPLDSLLGYITSPGSCFYNFLADVPAGQDPFVLSKSMLQEAIDSPHLWSQPLTAHTCKEHSANLRKAMRMLAVTFQQGGEFVGLSSWLHKTASYTKNEGR